EASPNNGVSAGQAELEEASTVKFDAHVSVVEADGEGLQDLRSVRGRRPSIYVCQAVQQLEADDSTNAGKEGDDKAAGSKGANRDGAVNAGMVEESSTVKFHPNVSVSESANTEGLQDLRRVKGRMQTAYVSEAVQQLDSDDSDDDGKEGDDKAAGSNGANRDGAVNAGMVEESSIVQFHPNVDVVEFANTEGWQDLRRVKGRVQTAYVTEAVQQLDSDDSDDDGKEGDDKAAGSRGANRDGAENAGMVEESSIVQFHPNVDVVESANTEGWQDLRRVKGRVQTAYVTEAVQQLDSDDSDDDGKEGDDKAAGSRGANRDGAENAGMVEESSIVQFHPNVDVVESANTEGLQDLRRVKGRMQTAYVTEEVQQLDSDDSDDDGKEGDDKAAGSNGANRDGAVNAGMVEESSIVQFHPNVDVVESANTEGWQDLRRVKGRVQTAYVTEAVQQLDSDDSDDDGKEGDDKAAGSRGANRDGAENAGMVEESSIVQFHPNVDVVESANTEGWQDLRRVKGRVQTAYVTEAVQQLDSDDSDDDGKEGDDKAAGSNGANRDGAVNAGMVEESSIVQFHPNVDVVESANTEGWQDLRRVKGRVQTAYVSEAVQQLDSDDSDDDGKKGDDKAAGSRGANRDGAENAGMVEYSSTVKFDIDANVDVDGLTNGEGWQDLRRVKGRMQTAYVSEAVQHLDADDSDDDGNDKAAGSKGANRDGAMNAGMVEESSTMKVDANVGVVESANTDGLQDLHSAKWSTQNGCVFQALQQLDADDSDKGEEESKALDGTTVASEAVLEKVGSVQFSPSVTMVESENTEGLQDLRSAKGRVSTGLIFRPVQQLDENDSDDDDDDSNDEAAGSEGANRDSAITAGRAVLKEVGSVQFSPSVTLVESANTEGLQDLKSANSRTSTGFIFRPVQQLDENDSCADGNDEAAESVGA
ncbi:unnamed protein product, partial [Polarella glacialis]